MKGVIDNKIYHYFLALSIAISILLTDDFDDRVELLDYAEELLKIFVRKCQNLYGDKFCVYNVHNLLHLCEDVRHFNCSLNALSAFPFENCLYRIKHLVQYGPNPLVQVVKRLIERRHLGRKHQRIQIKITTISDLYRDSCIMLKNGNYAVVKAILGDDFECDVYPSKKAVPFYLKPCSSKLLGIYQFKESDALIDKMIAKCDVKCKAIRLLIPTGCVMMPVRNSCERYSFN